MRRRSRARSTPKALDFEFATDTRLLRTPGLDGYHDAVCAEIELPPAETAVLATAANYLRS
jgi:hypothetical protein